MSDHDCVLVCAVRVTAPTACTFSLLPVEIRLQYLPPCAAVTKTSAPPRLSLQLQERSKHFAEFNMYKPKQQHLTTDVRTTLMFKGTVRMTTKEIVMPARQASSQLRRPPDKEVFHCYWCHMYVGNGLVLPGTFLANVRVVRASREYTPHNGYSKAVQRAPSVQSSLTSLHLLCIRQSHSRVHGS